MAKVSKVQPGLKRAESAAPKAGFSLSPRAILNMFLERWWIGLIAGVLVAAGFLLFQPKQIPIYYTETELLFEPRAKRILPINGVVDDSVQSVVDLNTHLARLRSDRFYDYVQQSLTPKEIELIQAPYRDPQNPNATPSVRSILRPSISMREDKGTTIVHIGVQLRDPEAAALVANLFAQKYIFFMQDYALTGTNSAILWLRQLADEQRSELEAATRAMQDFREKHSMSSVGETINIVADKIKSLGTQIVQAENTQTTYRALIDAIDHYQKSGRDLMEIDQISSYGNLAQLRTDLQNLKAERVILSDRYLDEHPRMKDNQLQIDSVESRMKANIALAIEEMRSRYNLAVQNEKQLRDEYAKTEKQLNDLDKMNDTYKFLQDDYTNKNSALSETQRRLQDLTTVSQQTSDNIRILDTANVPALPANATPKQTAIAAAAMGVILLFGLPIGLGLLDSRVKSPNDVEGGLEQTLLGGIKTMKKLSETERPNVFRLGKDDSLSEAYRGIFSEIEIRSVVPFPKRLMVTSSVPSEGKSLTASNLAAVFAAHGRKTLLVDCDFRRPTLRRYFGATAGIGLLPWLRENAHRPDVQVDTHKMGIMNIGPAFDLLPAGDAIKNPTEIIDQIAACDLFNKLSKHYDLIVIDTPPSAVFPDALLLSRFCSEMVYVCRFKTVRKALIKKTLAKFTDSGIGVLGVVLNCVPSSSVRNYGYDGYGSYNSEYYRSYQTEKVAS